MFHAPSEKALRWQPAWQAILCVALLIGPELAGCSNCNLMGGNFADNSLGNQVSQYRKPDPDAQKDGVSTKSQQIEKDLGY